MNNNKRATKRALLTSVMALVMCVVMLVGTTFAWFTDTASTGVNKIQAGNLDVELEYKNADTSSFTEATKDTKVFKDGALWEPGHVEYVVLKISNIGNLALKYKLGINIADETGSTNVFDKAFKLSEYIRFAVLDGDKSGETRDNLVAAATDSKLINAGYASDDTTLYPKATLAVEGQPSEKIVTLVVWMPDSVGNEANHAKDAAVPSIDLGINVVATQAMVENDSFDNKYDEKAPLDFVPVSNQAELQNAINAAAPGEDVNVSLEGNITIADTMYVIGNDVGANVGAVTIQANGKTLTSDKAQATRCLRIEYTNVERDITIIGAKVVSEGTGANGSGNGANENRGLALFDVKNATINLVNCEIEMKANNYAYAIKMINCDNVTLNLTGCTLTGANCIETNGGNGNTVNITDCVFNSNYAPNATYCGQGIQDKDGNNNTFNIKNTTFNGTNVQPWETNATTVINNLGGNVNNTTRTTA